MNETDNTVAACPKCGAVIPGDAPQGLCPKCVLAAAACPTEVPALQAAAIVAPPMDQVQAAFPNLEILDLLGQGGMGVVFKARQRHLDRLVALKLLPDALGKDPRFVERFNREGRVLARLNHPNIVAIYDFGQVSGFCFLMMEFVDGVNLRQAMRAGRFTPGEALGIVPKVCEALQFAHEQGVLHRDIKPENILLDAKGRVKIADFGIAKLVGEGHPEVTLTGSGSPLGTPHYMAPEQVEHPGEVDHRADIYSLGVVFYEMLTGELPLGRFAAPSQKTPLDQRVDDIVLRALAKERELRQQSAGEVKTQVESLAETVVPGKQPRPTPVATTSAPTTASPAPANPNTGASSTSTATAAASQPHRRAAIAALFAGLSLTLFFPMLLLRANPTASLRFFDWVGSGPAGGIFGNMVTFIPTALAIWLMTQICRWGDRRANPQSEGVQEPAAPLPPWIRRCAWLLALGGLLGILHPLVSASRSVSVSVSSRMFVWDGGCFLFLAAFALWRRSPTARIGVTYVAAAMLLLAGLGIITTGLSQAAIWYQQLPVGHSVGVSVWRWLAIMIWPLTLWLLWNRRTRLAFGDTMAESQTPAPTLAQRLDSLLPGWMLPPIQPRTGAILAAGLVTFSLLIAFLMGYSADRAHRVAIMFQQNDPVTVQRHWLALGLIPILGIFLPGTIGAGIGAITSVRTVSDPVRRTTRIAFLSAAVWVLLLLDLATAWLPLGFFAFSPLRHIFASPGPSVLLCATLLLGLNVLGAVVLWRALLRASGISSSGNTLRIGLTTGFILVIPLLALCIRDMRLMASHGPASDPAFAEQSATLESSTQPPAAAEVGMPAQTESSEQTEPSEISTNANWNAAEARANTLAALARDRLADVRSRMAVGQASPSELALAEHDVAIAEAKGNPVTVARANLALAKSNLEDARKKFEVGVIPSGELRAYEATNTLAEIDLREALLKAGIIDNNDTARIQAEDQARLRLDIAKKTLENFKKQADVGTLAPRGKEMLEAEMQVAIAEAEVARDPLGAAKARVDGTAKLHELYTILQKVHKATDAELEAAAKAEDDAQKAWQALSNATPTPAPATGANTNAPK